MISHFSYLDGKVEIVGVAEEVDSLDLIPNPTPSPTLTIMIPKKIPSIVRTDVLDNPLLIAGLEA